MIIARVFGFLFLISFPLSAEVGDIFIQSSFQNTIQRKTLLKLNETCIHKVGTQSYIVPDGLTVKEGDLVFTGTREPSKALKSFVRKQTNKERWVIDGSMAMQIANGFYALKALGDSLFDFHALNMAFQRELRWAVPVEGYSYSRGPILSAERENSEGCVMNNHWHTTWFGDSGVLYQSVNVISCGCNEKNEMTFLGFNPIFEEGPKTKNEIYEELATHFCYDPIPDGPVQPFYERQQKGYQTSFENDKEGFFNEFDKIQTSRNASTVFREIKISMEMKERVRRAKESFEMPEKQLEEFEGFYLMSTNGDGHD